MRDVLVVVGTARLTFDPELRSLPSGASVCRLRIAWSTSRKDGESWVDKPNYADLSVFGKQGEACAKYLAKGRQIVFQARLEWREWDDKDSGKKRSTLEMVADQVQFVGSGDREGGGGFSGREEVPASDFGAAPTGDFAAPAGAASVPSADDDIPFRYDDPYGRSYREYGR